MPRVENPCRSCFPVVSLALGSASFLLAVAMPCCPLRVALVVVGKESSGWESIGQEKLGELVHVLW